MCVASMLALSACGEGSNADAPPVANTVQVAKPKPLSQTDPEAYHDNLESAMKEVPASMRIDFQNLLTCTVRKEAALGAAKPLTAERVRQMTAQIKADPAAVTNCQST